MPEHHKAGCFQVTSSIQENETIERGRAANHTSPHMVFFRERFASLPSQKNRSPSRKPWFFAAAVNERRNREGWETRSLFFYIHSYYYLWFAY
jgi:hypothetical protein